MERSAALLLLASMISSPSAAQATDDAPLAVGDEIRLLAPPPGTSAGGYSIRGEVLLEGKRTITFRHPEAEDLTLTHKDEKAQGRIVDVDDETITVEMDGSSHVFRRQDIASVEVRHQRWNPALGGLLGAGLGFGVGLALGTAATSDSTGFEGIGTGLAIVGSSLVIGIVAGASLAVHWEPVDGERLKVAVAPSPRGVGAQFALTF